MRARRPPGLRLATKLQGSGQFPQIGSGEFGEGSRHLRKEKETRVGARRRHRQGLPLRHSPRPLAARRPFSARLPCSGPTHSPG